MIQSIPRDLLAGCHILLLDDEPDSLEVAETILSMYSATVHTATNGKEGLQILNRIRPDFIISDISMPIMDGWDFIATIQKDRGLAEIPVIALTAQAVQEDRVRAITAGFHNYMTKPLTVQTFMADLLHLLLDVPELNDMLSNPGIYAKL